MTEPNPPIVTAIIPIAGWGTRWLPLTKAIEKGMLPLGNRPIVDWIVADCVAAGITRIIFVVGEGQTQIRQYFSHNALLDDYLTRHGKQEALNLVRQPQYKGVHFEFVLQPADAGYGTALPVALCVPKLAPDESVVVLMGDDIVYRDDGGNEVADFMAAWQASDAPNALMTCPISIEVAKSGKYGLIRQDKQGYFAEIIEKPSPEAVDNLPHEPSINISKYIFCPGMLAAIWHYVADGQREKEFFITTPISEAVGKGMRYYVHSITGQYLDAGNPENWLQANTVIASSGA